MAENVKVGIIGAMDSEVALLKSKVEGARTHELAGLEFVEGTLEGVGVVVVKCGVGKVNAAMCAQALVSVLGCNRVINTGVAGSLDARIEIGDIVVSTDAVEHDMDVTALGYAPGEHPDLHLVAFEADAGLRGAVTQAARDIEGVSVFEGRVCSGDQFIGSAAAKERIVSTFGGRATSPACRSSWSAPSPTRPTTRATSTTRRSRGSRRPTARASCSRRCLAWRRDMG